MPRIENDCRGENGKMGLSQVTPSHTRPPWPLSQRWSVIRPHPVCRRKGRMCIVSLFDGVEAARPNLWYPAFSLTKLRRGRAHLLAAAVWADPGCRRPPSNIPTTLRYSFLCPCSTAHLPTLLHVDLL